MSKSEYEQVYDNVSFEIKPGKNNLHLMCCDCSLIHIISIEMTKNKKIKLTLNRDNRATAQARRKRYKKGK